MLSSRRLRSCVTSFLSAATLLAVPTTASAWIGSENLEIGMYGRIGASWNPQTGRYVHGKSLNLLGNPLGGRFEEGDYMEPTIKLHIVKPVVEEPTKPWYQVVVTPAFYSSTGSFLGASPPGFSISQAYLEAGNVLTPDLTMWVGQRFYRSTDVHIADIFFFNQLVSQGAGVKYKGLDLAVLLQTSQAPGLYSVPAGPETGNMRIDRQRTVFVGQYVLPVAEKHSLNFLAEFHLLPSSKSLLTDEGTTVQEADIGYVGGVKGRLDLGNGSFNELSVRVGGGIANGAFSASPTFATFGRANEDGKYSGALGIEAVEHLLINVSPLLTLNAYGILEYSKGADDGERTSATTAINNGTNFAVGVRSFLYLTDNFHLINEATFQGFKAELPEGVEDPGMPTAFRFSIVPTLVPSGLRSAWARPHIRLIYSLAVYNQAEVDLYTDRGTIGLPVSPYLNDFGAKKFGHFVGTRAEWWF
ncbi:maltoporin [Stigmatella aurantiaca]|uniref:Maltoporin n=1 Tax=Stigmatella aurantiaca TaxID=41 RepID=A0A1H7JPT8_STIAU|nr:carbohydrate porin [Stigmatella aurantiaca]SEK76603.1 maltoporin [Stigmatella aurantiaca]